MKYSSQINKLSTYPVKSRGDQITPKMIEAGVAAYAAWKPDDFSWVETEPDLVARVFLAMLAASGKRLRV